VPGGAQSRDPHISATIRFVGLSQLSPGAARAVERAKSGAERLTASELSPVLRTIPVDQTIAAVGLRITLVDAAVQEDGCRLLFSLEAGPPGTSSLDTPRLRMLECTVTDDQGVGYDVWTPPWSTTAAHGQLAFSPAPSNQAHEVTVRIERLVDWTVDALMTSEGEPADLREGPWVFRFSVRPRDDANRLR
jgi:hypothetical protein